MPFPYCIKDGYEVRNNNEYDPEIVITDDYQNEVYFAGLELVEEHGLQSVLDIGTGRGFKLIKYFEFLTTLGLDLPPTVRWLQSAEGYPTHNWAYMPLDGEAPIGYDLVVCADVIEHIIDPDQVCDFIRRTAPKFAIISTPDRDLLKYRGKGPTWDTENGPPYNKCHVREWSYQEFWNYMNEQFPGQVIKHWYPNRVQVCQGVIIQLRSTTKVR